MVWLFVGVLKVQMLHKVQMQKFRSTVFQNHLLSHLNKNLRSLLPVLRWILLMNYLIVIRKKNIIVYESKSDGNAFSDLCSSVYSCSV